MMRYLRSLPLIIGFVLISAGSAGSADLTVEQRCVIEKAKATWKYSRCVTKAQITGVKKNLSEAKGNELVDFCNEKLIRRFQHADARAGVECATTDVDPGAPDSFHGPQHVSFTADAQQCLVCHKK